MIEMVLGLTAPRGNRELYILPVRTEDQQSLGKRRSGHTVPRADQSGCGRLRQAGTREQCDQR
jgi:hypothetical protein